MHSWRLCKCFVSLQVIIDEPLDYSNKTVQYQIEEMMTTLEDHPNIEGGASESWLRDFLDYVKRNEPFEAIDISNEKSFVKSLSSVSPVMPLHCNGPFFNNFISFPPSIWPAVLCMPSTMST